MDITSKCTFNMRLENGRATLTVIFPFNAENQQVHIIQETTPKPAEAKILDQKSIRFEKEEPPKKHIKKRTKKPKQKWNEIWPVNMSEYPPECAKYVYEGIKVFRCLKLV